MYSLMFGSQPVFSSDSIREVREILLTWQNDYEDRDYCPRWEIMSHEGNGLFLLESSDDYGDDDPSLAVTQWDLTISLL